MVQTAWLVRDSSMASPQLQLWDQIVAVIKECGMPMKSIDIARKIGGKVTKKSVNVELYRHRDVVFMATESPPMWQLKLLRAGQVSSVAPDSQTITSSNAEVTSFHVKEASTMVAAVTLTDKDESLGQVSSMPVLNTPVLSHVSVTPNTLSCSPSTQRSVSLPEHEARLLRVVEQSTAPLSALSIAKKVGRTTASDVNRTLYALERSGQLERITQAECDKPLWKSARINPSHVHVATRSFSEKPVALSTPNPQRNISDPVLCTTRSPDTAASNGTTPAGGGGRDDSSRCLYRREDSVGGQISFVPVLSPPNEVSAPLVETSGQVGIPEACAQSHLASDQSSLIQNLNSLKLKIMELLGRRTDLPTGDIKDELGLETRTPAMAALQELEEEGKVRSREDRASGLSFWSLK